MVLVYLERCDLMEFAWCSARPENGSYASFDLEPQLCRNNASLAFYPFLSWLALLQNNAAAHLAATSKGD